MLWLVGAGGACGGRGGAAADASSANDAAFDGPADASSANDAARDSVSDGAADTASPSSVFKLSDVSGLRLQVASDRTGVPVVMWTDPVSGATSSVAWNEAERQWAPLETLDGAGPYLIDPDGSGLPLLRWNVPQPANAQSFDMTTRRFDPASGAWGAPVSLPDLGTEPSAYQLAIDGAGNAHALWHDGSSPSYWSWWRGDGAVWEVALPFEELYQLVAVPAATFMWFERNALGVRRFDAPTASWSDVAQLADLTQESSLRTHLLVVGRDGAPLMASLRRDPAQLAVEAWHGQPGTNLWGTRELIEDIPVTSDPNQLAGPVGACADPDHDFIWVPVPLADGSFDLHVERYDPGQGAWALSRVLHNDPGLGVPGLDLRTDQVGRAYGYSAGATLMRLDPAAPTWRDTASGMGSGILRVSDSGAFVVGYANGDELVAFRSDAGGEWRAARGYSGGAHPSVGSVPYAMEIAGPERAVVVWTIANGADAGVWAAFLE